MPLELKISLTDDDYIDFNRFWMMRSHYGRSEMLKMRFVISVLFVLMIVAAFFTEKLLFALIARLVAIVITLVAFQLLYAPVMSAALKWHIKALKKKGRMGYSPESTMIFGEEAFTEITPTARTEQAYSALERVSVIGDGVIYLHLSNVAGYILPAASFATAEERLAFIEFIKTKCDNIDRY